MSGTGIAVIGAGPAGLAAAVEARRLGFAVTVLDEQLAPGGQILRGIEGPAARRYEAWGLPLVTAFRQSGAVHVSGAAVWGRDGETLLYSRQGVTGRLRADAVVVATGAMERPMPVPGGTLPGVFSAGALQALLKGSGAVPQGRCVLAGSGPLLLLAAVQLAEAGAPPLAIVETLPRLRWLRSMLLAPALIGDVRLAAAGLRLLAKVRRAGIRMVRHATKLRALGGERFEALAFNAAGRDVTIEADVLGLHDGVVPNDHLAVAFGCETFWSRRTCSYAAKTTRPTRSSVPGIWIAGDASAIVGGFLATLEGRLAALDIAAVRGAISASAYERAARPLLAERRRRLRARRFIEALYAPTLPAAQAPDDALLCRCEEVTMGAARNAIAQGADGPRRLKAATRCGMGPCQGRQCTLPMMDLLADALGADIAGLARPALRTPSRPITVAELAASHAGEPHSGSDA